MSNAAPPDAVVQAVQAYIAKAFDPGSLPPAVAESLRNGSLSLLQLIRILGEYLTSEDERTRSTGVELLAQVVLDLAPGVPEPDSTADSFQPIPSLFDRQAVRTLTGFFADKLEDGSNVAAIIAKATNSAEPVVAGSAPSYRFKSIPEGTEMLACSLKALRRLAKLETFGSEQARNVTQNLIDHVKPRDHPQAVRFLVYSLLDALLSKHRNTLKSMGKDFTKGYVDLAEGEKDPRNLMYLFAMDRVILIEWELDAELAEDFYDITYCYFPITFKPPPDDPYGITSDDLKTALRRCLTANPALAPHAMPLLLEKLAASGGNTKRDTLQTLEEAMPVFGKAAILANENKLWEGFKVEIMAATDDETSVYAQRALSSFLKTLYQDVDPPEGIAPRIVAEALSELEEPEKSLAGPASELLVAMVKACPSTCYLATYALLDQMLTMFKDPDVLSIRAPILGHIATLLRALREVYATADGDAGSPTTVPQLQGLKFAAPSSDTANLPKTQSLDSTVQDVEMAPARTYDGDRRPLDGMRDELLSALSNGIRSSQYRSNALLAFVHLTHIPSFLSAAETNYMAESVNDLILSPSAEDIRGAALDGLRDVARVNPKVLEETTLPMLFARLPDRMPSSSSTGGVESRGTVRRALGALARLCAQPDLFDMLVVKVFTKLDLTCAYTFTQKEERDNNVGYARGLIVTISTVLEEKAVRGHSDVARYGLTLCPRLFSSVLSAATREEDIEGNLPPVAADDRVIREIGRLLILLIRSLAADKQQNLATWLYAAFLEGKTSFIFNHQNGESSAFRPFDSGASAKQRQAVYAFAAASVPLKKEVGPPPVPLPQWLKQLLDFILEASSDLEADAAYTLATLAINKYCAEPLPNEVQELLSHFWQHEIANSSGTGSRRSRAIVAWFWMAKAFVVRNSKTGEAMIEQAREALFPDAKTGKEAAAALALVAQSDDGVLNKENGATIRLLYRQKFFSYLLPKIINGYKSAGPSQGSTASADIQSTYLIALAAVLPSMPAQTTTDRLSEIFPLLIQALSLSDATARWSAARTVAMAAAIGRRDRDAEIKAGSGSEGLAKQSSTPGPLDLIHDHANTVIDRLLSIAHPSPHSPPHVRIAALRCLSTIAKCVNFSGDVAKAKARVLKTLWSPGVGVDDPKKAVRSQAVDCKEVWHLAE